MKILYNLCEYEIRIFITNSYRGFPLYPLYILHKQLITYSRWRRLTRKCDWPWFNCEHLNNRHCVKGVAETDCSVYRRFDNVLATERIYTVKSAQIISTEPGGPSIVLFQYRFISSVVLLFGIVLFFYFFEKERYWTCPLSF